MKKRYTVYENNTTWDKDYKAKCHCVILPYRTYIHYSVIPYSLNIAIM